MSELKSILLENAKIIDKKILEGEYSPKKKKIVKEGSKGEELAIYTESADMITHSKTEAYPGDDDPDPEQRLCY